LSYVESLCSLVSIMQKLLLPSLLLITLIGGVFPAHANDFEAGKAGSGIHILQNDSIQMLSEVLKITPDLVDVTYVYKNLTDQKRTILIGFPIKSDMGDLETHITNTIRPRFDPRITPPSSSRYVKAGWELGSYNGNNVYLREQVFGPHEVVIVNHRYTPKNGSGVYGVVTDRWDRVGRTHGDACSSFTDEELESQGPEAFEWDFDTWEISNRTEHLEYILTTGTSWAGPIKKFRLEIGPSTSYVNGDYGVLHCFEGLERTPDGRYVVEIDDFVPKHNLYLTFFYRTRWEWE